MENDPAHFNPHLTAFRLEEPPDWFVCAFYARGFPRQNAQEGAYSMTARFCRDHAEAISGLLGDAAQARRFVVLSKLKSSLRTELRERHGISRGTLFPDSEGAALTAGEVFERPALALESDRGPTKDPA